MEFEGTFKITIKERNRRSGVVVVAEFTATPIGDCSEFNGGERFVVENLGSGNSAPHEISRQSFAKIGYKILQRCFINTSIGETRLVG